MGDGSATRKRAPRRDAQRRRAALLTAAAECFRERGYDVPLEAIADRAGVGRGTLYRNFRDREALALAIFSREIDRFEAALDPAAPLAETLGTMVRQGAPVSDLYRRIAADLHRREPEPEAFEALRDRLERLLGPVVAQAQARGELDRGIVASDLVLALQMAGGLLRPLLRDAEVAQQISAALRLLLAGLRPR